MILILEQDITDEQKSHLRSVLFSQGCIVREISDAGQNIIGAIGKGKQDIDYFSRLPGVAKAVPIRKAFKLVSREMHSDDTRVQVGDVTIGGEQIAIIAGPCAVESREQALTIAREVKRYGAVLFRGGAFKPRTSPYSFQGLEEEGLKILAEVRDTTGLGVVTEITSPRQADLMMKYVDVVQIGARNVQNFELLKCVGRMGKPVMLKRGLASTIEEWLMSAEYILSEGNDQVILCERGIRTFEPLTRNTLDLSAVPVLKKLTHLPVVIDPSHATRYPRKSQPHGPGGHCRRSRRVDDRGPSRPRQCHVGWPPEPISQAIRPIGARFVRDRTGSGQTVGFRPPGQGRRQHSLGTLTGQGRATGGLFGRTRLLQPQSLYPVLR